MHPVHASRIAFSLKCKPEEVPMDDEKLKDALDKQIKELRAKKLEKVKHG